MDNCKACGEWFVSSSPAELCMSCERALKRLGKYVAPVVHGRWIDNGIPGSMLSGCSECGFTCGAYSFKYCPNCWAKMDKEAHDGLDTP